MVQLEETVGKGKAEEEPEGEVIAGPNGEAVGQSSGIAQSFPFFQNLITSSITPPN